MWHLQPPIPFQSIGQQHGAKPNAVSCSLSFPERFGSHHNMCKIYSLGTERFVLDRPPIFLFLLGGSVLDCNCGGVVTLGEVSEQQTSFRIKSQNYY